MDSLTILTWAIGGGFAGTWAMILYITKSINGRLDKTDGRLDKIEERVTDIDRRLCRIEGMMTRQDCCALKASRQEKAE